MTTMTRLARSLAALAVVSLASGCATPLQAPRYQPSIENVEALKKLTQPVALGAFTVQPGAPGGASVQLRALQMTSSVGSDYAAYLADALKQDLALAGKLDPQSKIVISGLLLKNDVSASRFSSGGGEIEARFTVMNNGQQRYSQVKRAELSWESEYLPSVGIPKAQQQYPLVVQKLLALLLADTDFLAALK